MLELGVTPTSLSQEVKNRIVTAQAVNNFNFFILYNLIY